MNTQSKINAVKSRIAQIQASNLFNKEEKEVLVRANNKELKMLIGQLPKPNNQPLTAAN